MKPLIEVLHTFCVTLPAVSEQRAEEVFRSVRGRDDFGPRLCRWLRESAEALPEPVRVEHVEHPQDHGVDVFLEGLHSKVAVSFQIKSNHDLKDGFLKTVKAQLKDSESWGNIGLTIIVLGCGTGRRQRDFTQQLVVHAGLNWRPHVLVLTPVQVATLWERCDRPLQKAEVESLLQNRSWEKFFHQAGQPERGESLRQIWPGLSPGERFVPPHQIGDIESALASQPLTILSGPPAAGKTFVALQMLYRHFREGKPVVWIAPDDGRQPDAPVPSAGATGLGLKIARLSRRLGLGSQHAPIDEHEFVAAQLRPGALVLIEDPFGETEADYAEALHTRHDFFDLRACAEAIRRSGARHDCRILLTSRHGLFDRWQDDLRQRGELPPSMHIIRLSPDSYSAPAADPAKHPLTQLAGKLLVSSGKVDAAAFDTNGPFSNEGFDMAHAIGHRAKTPREAELIVLKLPSPATWESIEAATGQIHQDVQALTRALCHAETPGEQLFLFLLCGLSTFHYKHRDFSRHYAFIHRLLELSGDPTQDEEAARRRYWGLYYTLPTTRSKYLRGGRRRAKPERESVEAGQAPEADKDFVRKLLETEEVPGRTDVHPAHASVAEVVSQELARNGADLVNAIARQLLSPSRQDEEPEDEDGDFNLEALRHEIFLYLLSFGPLLEHQAISLLSERMPDYGSSHYIVHGSTFLHSVLQNWRGLPLPLRQSFVRFLGESKQLGFGLACSHLLSHPKFPLEDAWRFYGWLLARGEDGVNGLLIESGWEFFLIHLDEAPKYLRGLFDIAARAQLLPKGLLEDAPPDVRHLLEELAQSQQEWRRQAAYMLGKTFAVHWDKMPTEWRRLALDDDMRAEKEVQKQVFWGMTWPLRWRTCPEPLVALLREQTRHQHGEIRALAATFNLIHREFLPPENAEAVLALFRVEPEVRVLRQILRETHGDGGLDADAKEILVERLRQRDPALVLEEETMEEK